MGKRTATETIGAVLVAFLERRTWKQAELARHLEISTRQLQTVLHELSAQGVPLESEREHPHVFWSVPRTWFPGGLFLDDERGKLIARLIARLPRTKERESVLASLFDALPSLAIAASFTESPEAPGVVGVLEDGAVLQRAVRTRYFTASRGDRSTRVVSVHRIVFDGHPRFIATCHRSNELRWFRVDGVERAELDEHEPYRPATRSAIDDFVSASVDGFHGSARPIDVAFFVREPESRWVTRNLPAPLAVEPMKGGARVTGRTAGLDRLAAYVVGLGGAATAETPELRAKVLEIARGALAAHRAARKIDGGRERDQLGAGELNERSVRGKRVAR